MSDPEGTLLARILRAFGVDMADGVVEVSGSLAPGTDAWLVAHFGGAYQAHYAYGERVAEGQVGDDGVVRFEGLTPGQRYWLVGETYQNEQQGIAVTAKLEGVGSPFAGLEQPRPGSAHGMEPQEIPEDRPDSGEVGPRQQDVPLDVVQRSDTPVGVATPIPAGERSPYPSQGEAGGVQSSDTEVGKHVPATTVRSGSGSGATVAATPASVGWPARTRWRASCSALTGEEPADVTEHDDVVPVSHVEETPVAAAPEVAQEEDVPVDPTTEPPAESDAEGQPLEVPTDTGESVEQGEPTAGDAGPAVTSDDVGPRSDDEVLASAQDAEGQPDEADAQ